MKGKRILVGLTLSIYMITAGAQQGKKQSFEEYRKEVLTHYDIHRNSVLDEYSDYLKGVWKSFQSFKGEISTVAPKPEWMPQVDFSWKSVSPVIWQPDVAPAADAVSLDDTVVPLKSFSHLPLNKRKVYIFYDLEIELPQLEKAEVLGSCSPSDVASYWKRLQEKHFGAKWMSEVQSITSIYGFNDWLKIDFVRYCVIQDFGETTVETRMALIHFLLVHLGYNVRLGITDAKQFVLLIPFNQMVYGCPFIKINGEKYYIYFDLQKGQKEETPIVSTCEIPENINNGRVVDLIFRNPVALPVNETKEFSITDGRLTIDGTVSETLMKMLCDYPQMPVVCYAKSILQPEMRSRIVGQLKLQVSDMNELDAVNAILRFVQYGFQYATDRQQFGYEKPFFMEELLYYPQCDCEDRAVFYAYLLRHVLGLDCHLIKFPGHECVAVKLSHPVGGSGYMYKGAYYSISDPTYMGATTGMCMPDYLHEQPIVECWLGNNP